MQRLLLSLAALSLAAIVVTSGLVLTSSPLEVVSTAEPVLAVGKPSALADSGLPDPTARGVILITADNYYRAFTPAGVDLGTPNSALPSGAGLSADGKWLAVMQCLERADVCPLSLTVASSAGSSALPQRPIPLASAVEAAEWAPVASVLAARDAQHNLYLIDAATQSVPLTRHAVSAYAWSGRGDLVFATQDAAGSTLWRAGATGRETRLAQLQSPVTRLLPSPEAASFAFSQNDAGGWRLLSIDAASGKVTDYGHLGARVSPDGATTVLATPPPFSLAWSRDGRYLAASPATAPFVLDVFDVSSGSRVVQHFFAEGYAGELKWSPVSNELAISTYSPDRTRHEIYVLDLAKLTNSPVDGTSRTDPPRHLLSGCKIEWSPDGEFIAARREPHTAGGLEIIRTSTGVHWRIAASPKLTPLAWGVDQKDAVERSIAPYRMAAVLAK